MKLKTIIVTIVLLLSPIGVYADEPIYMDVEKGLGIVVLSLALGFILHAPSAVMLSVLALVLLLGPQGITQAYTGLVYALIGIGALSMTINTFRE